MLSDKPGMRRDKLFILFGLSLLAIALYLSMLASFLTSPREKAVVPLQLPEVPEGEVRLGEGVSERLYYHVAAQGDRRIQLSVYFYNKEGEPVGGFYIEYSGVNSSGWLVLQESPYSIHVRSNCTTCRSSVEVTLYYSRLDRSEVNALSLTSTVFSILGMALLTGGLYSYIARRYLVEERFSKDTETLPRPQTY